MGRKSKGEGTFSRNNIRELREKKGLSQTELAELAGISSSQLSRLELGKRPSTLDMLDRIGRVLEATRQALVGEPKSNNPTESASVYSYVQAGVFAEHVEWSPEDRFTVTIQDNSLYPGATRHASKVRGPSMDKIYPDGSVIIWVEYSQIDEPLIPGRRYVVNRYDRAGKMEHTCKTFGRDIKSGAEFFYPESNDPEFQTPIPFEDDEEFRMEVAGRVINSIRND